VSEVLTFLHPHAAIALALRDAACQIGRERLLVRLRVAALFLTEGDALPGAQPVQVVR